MAKLNQLWINLRSSLWFLPLLLVSGLIAAAYGLIELDSRVHTDLADRWPRLFATSAEGARAMLSAIATSMMTVAGVVFSITIVALAQASAQYSPRVLRNFMRDRSNQIVFGTFVGIFAYCLVVLRNIAGDWTGAFVPTLAVLVGFCLSIIGIGFLIYFIHHIATGIQASEMVAAIAGETIATAHKLFTQKADENEEEHDLSCAGQEEGGAVVPAAATGYIQGVALEGLEKLAVESGIHLNLERRIGQFVIRGSPLVRVQPESALNSKTLAAIQRCFAIDTYRTVDQDPEFGIRQIVDISLKALSPGINDTGTAMTCLDYLSAIFSQLAPLRLEPTGVKHGRGRVRVKSTTFGKLLHDAFSQILENASRHAAVLQHMVTALQRVSDSECNPARQRQLLALCRLVHDTAVRLDSPEARADVQKTAAALIEKLISRSHQGNHERA